MRRMAVPIFFAALIALWQGLCAAAVWSPVLVPSPSRVGAYVLGALGDGSLPLAAAVTLRRLVLGYLFGVGVGMPLGLLTARFEIAARTLGVLALGVQTLPSVCWVPLALRWFGPTEATLLFVVLMGTVGSVAIATNVGVRGVPPIYARAARTMGSSERHAWTHVRLPAALPAIVSGLKQGWAFAWRSLMGAEIYVTIVSGFGLGRLLHLGREAQSMEQVIGIMLVITALGLAADRLLFAPWECWLRRRWGTGT